MELLNKKILKIHNYIYANDGLSNSETLNEFLKIFYCKILDEKSENSLYGVKEASEKLSILESLYVLLKHKLNGLIDEKEVINLKEDTILFILNELKDIKLSSINCDAKGYILQKIIDRSYRESRGQFFTPSPVVDFMVKMINPKRGEVGCDPAAGTGGFMFSALEHVSKTEGFQEGDLSNIHFYDISKNLIKLVAMRTMFEFSDVKVHYAIKDSIVEDYGIQFDYVLTNPPFGSQGKIQEKKILARYELGTDIQGNAIKSQVPDILFVEKVIKILKENGRAAIVLPDGDFENPTQEYFRRFLVENVRIDAVVSLPDGTFIPYGTGVKSSVIFFTKLNKEDLQKEIKNNYSIFYGKINKLGYTFSKHSKDEYLPDGSVDEDYSTIVTSYIENKYNDNAYIVKINDIIDNKYMLSESFYSPVYARTIEDIKKGNFTELKNLVDFKYKKERIEKDKTYRYIEIADVNAYTSEIINSTEMDGEDLPSRASYKLEVGDIIVATSGNSIGTKKQAKALVTESYADSICTNGFTVMNSNKISKYYLLKFFNSSLFLDQIKKYKYGTAIPCVARDDFENIIVPIPEKEEIERIEAKIKKAILLREEAYKLMNE